jgi:hypothetical protein
MTVNETANRHRHMNYQIEEEYQWEQPQSAT